MTRIEALVATFVIFSLVGAMLGIGLPAISIGGVKGQMTQVLSNMKQLMLATKTMTLDNETSGDSPIRWTCSNTTPLTFAQWSNAIVGEYMSETDLKKLFSAAESRNFWFDRKFTNVINIFAVTEHDPSNTVLFATRNWQGFGNTNLNESQYTGKGFIIMQKSGNGAILLRNQAASTNLIGLGGLHNYLPLR